MILRITEAVALANGLTLAALAVRKNGVVRLVAADGILSCTCADPTIAITATVPASVSEPGAVAVAAQTFAALASGLTASAPVTISTTETAAIIACGNSRSRLAIIPDMPVALAVTDKLASIEVSGSDCRTLLEPLFGVVSDITRFYLCGIFLHTVRDQLVAVCTDGVRLIRVGVRAAEFSTTRDLILPAEAAMVLRRLVTRTKPEVITLQRSKSLLAVVGPGFEFTSRLIDAQYPAYEAVVPVASPNAVTVDRAELLAALSRLAAVATAAPPLLALSWTNGGLLNLFLARQPDDGADAIAALARGAAKIAVPLSQLAGMIDEIKGERVHLEAAGPLVIRSKSEKLALLMPSAWDFSTRSDG